MLRKLKGGAFQPFIYTIQYNFKKMYQLSKKFHHLRFL